MLDFSNVYPSVLNWIITGIMAMTFIAFAKFVLAKYRVPGASELAGSI